MGWRVVGPEVGEPESLLEAGVRLLEGMAAEPVPTLRWYRSVRTAVVLGRGQREWSTEGVTVLSRHSGGGAVLMEPTMLSLDVVLPAGSALLEGDLGAVFVRCGRVWAAALEDLGVADVAVYEGAGTARRQGDARERLLAAVCYATVGRGEVLVGGRKILGLAQRRRRMGALVQCGLLRQWRPGPLLAALGADPNDPEIEKAAIGLDDVFAEAGLRAPTDDDVRAAVQDRFQDLMQGGM